MLLLLSLELVLDTVELKHRNKQTGKETTLRSRRQFTTKGDLT